MVKKSVLNKLERCHRIYEQVYQDSLMPVYEIARNANLARPGKKNWKLTAPSTLNSILNRMTSTTATVSW
jgi:hypothetical protein